jgi:hypothetical protein
MNFDKLFAWVAGAVMLFAVAGHLDDLQRWIWKAQARALYESRTATWGNPSIFIYDSKSLAEPAKHRKWPKHRSTEQEFAQ